MNWCVENKKKYLNFIPTTYKLDKRNLDKKMLEDLFKSNKKWIVKPINGSFRAGIHVVKDYKGINKLDGTIYKRTLDTSRLYR